MKVLSKSALPTLMALVITFSLAGCEGPAGAGECGLIPSDLATIEGSRRADLLNAFKFEQLESELAKLQKKNLSSDGGDLLTLRDLVDLQRMGSRSESLVRMWVDQRPQSFFAQMFAGMFYEDKAQVARGSGHAAGVRPEQWQNMSKYSELANGYLQKAISLDPQSALPHATFIVLAGRGGGGWWTCCAPVAAGRRSSESQKHGSPNPIHELLESSLGRLIRNA